MNINFDIVVEQALLRPTDEPVIYGDSSKLMNETGWKQKYTLEETIIDMINYWRKKYDYSCKSPS